KETNNFLKEVHSQVLQDVARRVNKSFQNFFRRLKNQSGQAGYPRFKQYGRYDSFTYPQSGFNLKHSQLVLSHLGTVNIKKHRKLEGKIKTCSIIVKNGKFYVGFSCENIEVKPKKKTNKKVGIDMGLNSFLTTSDGEKKEDKKIYRKLEKKAVRILAAKHEKVTNKRKDTAHKLAKELVEKYDLLAHEKLRVKNMEAGKSVVGVDARNTSQICSNCDKLREPKLKLSQRKFSCFECDYQENRDINAARNILKRAEGLGTSLQGAVPMGAV
ncbi:23404_t:CDS:2, partial [Racocetra persica]